MSLVSFLKPRGLAFLPPPQVDLTDVYDYIAQADPQPFISIHGSTSGGFVFPDRVSGMLGSVIAPEDEEFYPFVQLAEGLELNDPLAFEILSQIVESLPRGNIAHLLDPLPQCVYSLYMNMDESNDRFEVKAIFDAITCSRERYFANEESYDHAIADLEVPDDFEGDERDAEEFLEHSRNYRRCYGGLDKLSKESVCATTSHNAGLTIDAVCDMFQAPVETVVYIGDSSDKNSKRDYKSKIKISGGNLEDVEALYDEKVFCNVLGYEDMGMTTTSVFWIPVYAMIMGLIKRGNNVVFAVNMFNPPEFGYFAYKELMHNALGYYSSFVVKLDQISVFLDGPMRDYVTDIVGTRPTRKVIHNRIVKANGLRNKYLRLGTLPYVIPNEGIRDYLDRFTIDCLDPLYKFAFSFIFNTKKNGLRKKEYERKMDAIDVMKERPKILREIPMTFMYWVSTLRQRENTKNRRISIKHQVYYFRDYPFFASHSNFDEILGCIRLAEGKMLIAYGKERNSFWIVRMDLVSGLQENHLLAEQVRVNKNTWKIAGQLCNKGMTRISVETARKLRKEQQLIHELHGSHPDRHEKRLEAFRTKIELK
jgi:hypothetical protein